MSSVPGASSVRRWLCPGCDASPTMADDVDEPVCPECGTRLVQLNLHEVDDLVGQVIDGRFEIRALLGEGGMGTVYRAWQKSIGREVAIKVIDRRHGRDEMAVRRFLREARLASQLSQPNTVSIFDVGQSKDGRLFLAMELIRGRTLEQVVAADGVFSAPRAAHIGIQLCDALEAASRLKIVHRDLKPANVIVLDDPPGRDLLKVLDFGLAKSLVGEESGATQSGLIVGTPRYMAPEVLMGAAHTVLSDLYAVGVILGEIATGQVMWPTNSFSVLLANKFDGSPLVDQVPAPLRPIVAKLIHADPLRRHVSPMELRGALLPVLESRTPELEGATHELPALDAPAGRASLPKVSFKPAHVPQPPRSETSPSSEETRRERPAEPRPQSAPPVATPAPAAPPQAAADPAVTLKTTPVKRRLRVPWPIAVAAVLIVLGVAGAVVAVQLSKPQGNTYIVWSLDDENDREVWGELDRLVAPIFYDLDVHDAGAGAAEH